MIKTVRITTRTADNRDATIETIEQGERIAFYFGMHQEIFDTSAFLRVCELILLAMKEKEEKK
jgi:hypothetical protein